MCRYVAAYLEEGFFLDRFTKMLTVEIIMYNGNNRYLCNLVVEFEFTEGGNILVEYSAEAANSQPYWYNSAGAPIYPHHDQAP